MNERLFLALPVYNTFKAEIDSCLKVCKEQNDYKWTPLHALHITLHFFGNTTPEDKSKILNLVPGLISGIPPVSVTLEHISAFPDEEAPRIIFIDVHRDSFEGLMPLQQAVTGGLKMHGFKVEDRPYHPHVTLCRIKPEQVPAWKKQAWQFSKSPACVIDEVVLFRSILSENGARHLADTTWKLR